MKNIIICGAPRAGTTSLFRYLAVHPDISPSRVKELNFFLGGGKPWEDFWDGKASLDNYLWHFDKKKEWSLEASPAYMHPCHAKRVAGRMADLLTEAHLVLVLRDPIDRLFSQYNGLKERSGKLFPNVTFRDFAHILLERRNPSEIGIVGGSARLVGEGLRVGIYVDTLELYLQHFSPCQIYLVFSEDLSLRPQQTMDSICRWLGVSSEIYEEIEFTRENQMIHARSQRLYRAALALNVRLEPILNYIPILRHTLRAVHHLVNAKPVDKTELDEVRNMLQAFYAPHNARLRELIDRHWPGCVFPYWIEGN